MKNKKNELKIEPTTLFEFKAQPQTGPTTTHPTTTTIGTFTTGVTGHMHINHRPRTNR